MTEPIKILAVSMTGLTKHKAYAVYDGEKLIVTHISEIKGAFVTWRDALIEEIEGRRAEGYVCIVEEKTDHVSRFASQYQFDSVDIETGRTNLYEALDWYFPMMEMGHVVVAKEYQKFLIRPGSEGQRVERGQDDKGRITYAINWASFSSGHRALLLCVVGAMVEPVSDRYVGEMLDAWVKPEAHEHPLSSFTSITSGVVRAKVAARAKERPVLTLEDVNQK
ncbi:MAG: hypothetical protein ABIL58_23365 [Pseudomonadota bacterium]